MKKLMKRVLPIIGMAMILTTSAYANEADFGSTAAQSDDDYTLEEMLAYGLQDERMAQAEYEAIMEAFGVQAPFSNIAQAEISHEAAILNLYDIYGSEVPEFDATTHVIIPDTLEGIYAIGVTAEIANIAMYDLFLEEDLDDQVRAVFTALRDASVNHLAAFERGVSGGSTARNGQAEGASQSAAMGNGLKGQSGNSGKGQSVRNTATRSQSADIENCMLIND